MGLRPYRPLIARQVNEPRGVHERLYGERFAVPPGTLRPLASSWLSVASVWLSGRARLFISPIPIGIYQFCGGFVWYGRITPNRH